jgi:hypothetical protein
MPSSDGRAMGRSNGERCTAALERVERMIDAQRSKI